VAVFDYSCILSSSFYLPCIELLGNAYAKLHGAFLRTQGIQTHRNARIKAWEQTKAVFTVILLKS